MGIILGSQNPTSALESYSRKDQNLLSQHDYLSPDPIFSDLQNNHRKHVEFGFSYLHSPKSKLPTQSPTSHQILSNIPSAHKHCTHHFNSNSKLEANLQFLSPPLSWRVLEIFSPPLSALWSAPLAAVTSANGMSVVGRVGVPREILNPTF